MKSDLPKPAPTADGNEATFGADPSIDRLNLEQALRDFEVANRRVVDLALRTASLHQDLMNTRAELSVVRIELQQAQAQIARIKGSRLYPLAQVILQAKRTLLR